MARVAVAHLATLSLAPTLNGPRGHIYPKRQTPNIQIADEPRHSIYLTSETELCQLPQAWPTAHHLMSTVTSCNIASGGHRGRIALLMAARVRLSARWRRPQG